MAYRTLRQGASEASVPEDRADYVDYESTPEGRAKANLLALGMGGLGTLGAKAIAAAPSLTASTLRQWLATQGARRAAPEAVLMEPAAGAAARDAIVRGSVMNPRTAGATIAAGVPAAIPFVPGAGYPQPMPERGYEGDSPRERIAVTAANDILARQREAADSGLLDRANFHDENAVPNPQRAKMPLPIRRPAALDQQPAPQQSLLGRIFSGQDYQSSNALASDPRLAGYNAKVVQDGNINWGDRDSAADFFRADKAMMAQREAAKKDEEDTGKAKGGAVAGKDAALHKALEIIHHLLTRGH
jgi:hypothetical protein